MTKYYISVGEPWNFIGPDGRGIIKGEILKVITEKCLIFRSDNELEIDGIKGSVFFLFARHSDSSFPSNMVNNGVFTCNVGIYTGIDDAYLNMNPEELINNSKYVIIGGLHLSQTNS